MTCDCSCTETTIALNCGQYSGKDLKNHVLQLLGPNVEPTIDIVILSYYVLDFGDITYILDGAPHRCTFIDERGEHVLTYIFKLCHLTD
jgi:hypothetical protein